MLSICISRGKLGDEALIERIQKMIANRTPYSTIIQADGFPMSGGADDYKTTLQAVATAEIVQNANLPVYLMLSGGTNSKTTELAQMCSINYHAVAVGSYARKIIKKYIERQDFWTNQLVIEDALNIIKPLIDSVILLKNCINTNRHLFIKKYIKILLLFQFLDKISLNVCKLILEIYINIVRDLIIINNNYISFLDDFHILEY